MKNSLLITCLVLLSNLSSAQAPFKEGRRTVYFESNSFELDQRTKGTLFEIFELCKTDPDHLIFLSGHTDPEGNNNFNDALSQNRVEAVKEELISLGINTELLSTVHHGESKTVSRSEEEYNRDRRVEILVKFPSYREVASFVPASQKWFFRDFEKKPQIFYIKNNRATVIKGRGGTIMQFPDSAFCELATEVRIEMREYYSKAEMLLADLSTHSNNEILESGGMIDVRAFVGDKEIELCKEADIMIPDKLARSDMQLFKGHYDVNGENLNWDLMDMFGGDADSLKGISSTDMERYCEYDRRRSKYECPFFMCKIKRAVNATYRAQDNERMRYLGQQAREYNRVISVLGEKEEYDCTKLLNAMHADLIKKYGAKDYNDLQSKILEQRKKNRGFLEGTGEEVADYESTFLQQDVNYLVGKVSNLGLINCDRFTGFQRKTDFTVDIGESEGSVASKMIFKDINSILNGQKLDALKTTFKNIPVGEIVTVVVIKYWMDQVWMGTGEFQVGQKSPKLSFKPYDVDEFKRILN